MAAKTKRPKGVNASDYALATALKDEQYGPQIGAVRDLYRQAQKQYTSDIDAARAAEAATRANISSAVPRVRDIFAESGRSQANTASEVDAAMAARPPTTNPVAAAYQASLERERGTAKRQTATAKAGALTDLETRRIGAGSAREASINQATKARNEARSQLGQKLSDLLGARGSGVAAELAQLTSKRESAADKAASEGGSIYTSGAFTGKTKAEVAGMSASQRQQIVDAYNARGGKGKGKKGRGPDWLPKGQAAQGISQLLDLKKYAARAKKGEPFLAEHAGHGTFKPLSRAEAEQKISDNVEFNHPMLMRAAVDAIYDGHISAYTVKGLIKAGYKPSEVAETLKVLTSGTFKRQQREAAMRGVQTRKKNNPNALGPAY